MELVTTYEEALAGATEFQRVPELRDCVAYERLNKFSHWFYFEEIHGFAPSKFIGYAGTTAEGYDGSGTGTDTNDALQKLFTQVVRPSQQFDLLAEQLSAWLDASGSSLSAKTLSGTGAVYTRDGNSHSGSRGAASRSEVEYFEGHPLEVRQTRYERDPKARAECLVFYNSYECQACRLDFEKTYGVIGRQFIHVHHLKPLSILGTRHKVNPETDLLPLCPNCHAMIHRMPEPQTLDALRDLLA